MGIKVLPPDVNDSDFDFTPRGTDIRFGLSAIRNVGGNVVDSIIATRRRIGRFADFHDFIAKVDASRRATSASSSRSSSPAPSTPSAHTRKGLRRRSTSRSSTRPSTSSAPRRTASSTCSAGSRPRATRPWCRAARSRSASGTRRSCSAHEREMLGLYVSDHPLHGVERDARPAHRPHDRRGAARTIASTATVATVGGLVTSRAAQDHQAGLRVGDRHARGPRGLGRRSWSSRRPTTRSARCSSTTR